MSGTLVSTLVRRFSISSLLVRHFSIDFCATDFQLEHSGQALEYRLWCDGSPPELIGQALSIDFRATDSQLKHPGQALKYRLWCDGSLVQAYWAAFKYRLWCQEDAVGTFFVPRRLRRAGGRIE